MPVGLRIREMYVKKMCPSAGMELTAPFYKVGGDCHYDPA